VPAWASRSSAKSCAPTMAGSRLPTIPAAGPFSRSISPRQGVSMKRLARSSAWGTDCFEFVRHCAGVSFNFLLAYMEPRGTRRLFDLGQHGAQLWV
jgi:hypothetical protein